MNKRIKFIITVVLFILLIVISGYVYKYYSKTSNDVKNDTESLLKATDFYVYNANNEKVNLSDKIGKPIIVNFWASWCPPCKGELPAFDSIYKKYDDEVNFMMVDLVDGSRETREKADQLIQQNGYTFPIFYDLDKDAALAYSIRSIPYTIVIDKEGNLVKNFLGPIDEKTLEETIEALLK